RARNTVVWWSFTQQYDVATTANWRRAELAALERAGVRFPKPELLLEHRARAWRRAALAARERLILIVPESRSGQDCAPHPLWDEMVARAGLDERSRARITKRVAD